MGKPFFKSEIVMLWSSNNTLDKRVTDMTLLVWKPEIINVISYGISLFVSELSWYLNVWRKENQILPNNEIFFLIL